MVNPLTTINLSELRTAKFLFEINRSVGTSNPGWGLKEYYEEVSKRNKEAENREAHRQETLVQDISRGERSL